MTMTMKHNPAIIAIAFCSTIASAQTEAPDSLPAQDIQEIVIQAPKVIRKADMDVYHPSKSAIENSKNGMQLLNNLMIPSLNVSEAMGSIQAAGQSVQVRINGRESTIDQVRSLLPETIKRVEWIDNPGLRYGGANYVLNFIVSNPTLGGSFQGQARPALNMAWGFYMADAKFNVGRSQWEVYASCKLTENLKIYRDYTETFTYPDGSSISRNETPEGGSMNNSLPYYFASYNYIKPDTTVFVAQLTNQQHIGNKTEYNGMMSFSNGDDDVALTERYGDKGNYPSLSLYLQQNFAHRQMLVVDFNASMYLGRSWSDYMEIIPGADSYLTDIHTNIKDRNQAYAIETDYIKNWSNSRFTAGVSYKANRNRSEYENLDGSIFQQRQERVYLFGEYLQTFG